MCDDAAVSPLDEADAEESSLTDARSDARPSESFSVTFGVGVQRSGRATCASSVSKGNRLTLGKPRRVSPESASISPRTMLHCTRNLRNMRPK